MPEPSKRAIEVTGKSVDDAVQQALRRLSLSRPQVEVTVLAEGRAGIFGIGSNAARVRVTPRSSPAPRRTGGRPSGPAPEDRRLRGLCREGEGDAGPGPLRARPRRPAP